ncbi:MAG: peptide chain release factor N(5)-glutamine methyltransferase [Nitrospinota bacterium]
MSVLAEAGAEVRGLLRWARERLRRAGVEGEWLEAELLLAHVLGVERSWVLAHGEVRLAGEEAARFRAMVGERERRVPLAYLTGEKEFWSLPLRVGPSVLIPRPETELLVERALAFARGEGGLRRGLDVGTGAGALAVALAKELPGASFVATDSSPGALEVARENIARHGLEGRVRLVGGNLFDPIRKQLSFDLIASNPPYVSSPLLATLPPEVKWEPREALDGGRDGMRWQRHIIREAPCFLRPGGLLLLEMAPEQGPFLLAEVRACRAYREVHLALDLAGRPRCLEAICWP